MATETANGAPTGLSARARWTTAIVGGVVLIAAGLYASRDALTSQTRTIRGRVVSVDAVTRAATLEITHPKTGAPLELFGSIAPDCLIEKDGAAAQLADLTQGAQVEVTGSISASRRLTAHRVLVLPAMTSTSAPAQP